MVGSALPRFRHEALLYDGVDAFVGGTAGFVRDGLAAGEAVLVAVIEERARALREVLGAEAEHVEFLDIAEVGRNPARIIPAWQDWATRNLARGTDFRGIGEPIWVGRSELEIRECQMHEHLLNAAFDAGPRWRLLCPYDAGRLPTAVLKAVAGSHPAVLGAPVPEGSVAFDAHGGLVAFDEPLPELGPGLFEAPFDRGRLPSLRVAVQRRADLLGLHGRRVGDFVLVVDELACNSVLHGGGHGTLGMWAHDGHAVCEVRDAGLIRDLLVGRRRPDPGSPDGGAGLWTVNQLCDLVLIYSTPRGGTAVRAYMSMG